MAAQRVPQNLPPQSQQWVRDIERRMEVLERQNQLLQVTANQNAAQIGSIMSAVAAIPYATFASETTIGTPLVTFALDTNEITPVSPIANGTAVVIATIIPRSETGGGGGSVVTGEGEVFLRAYSESDGDFVRLDSSVIESVFSDPAYTGNGTAVLAGLIEPDYTRFYASMNGRFSGGVTGGGQIKLTLMVLPARSN